MDKTELAEALDDLAHEAGNAAQAVRSGDYDGARNALSRPLWPDTLTDHIREVEEDDEEDDDDA